MYPNSKRCGNRWTVNECLQLQREFELLNLSVNEIAANHKRTPNAIMFKLDQEGFANYNDLSSNYNKLNPNIKEVVFNVKKNIIEEEEEDYHALKQYISRLENQISSLTEMILQKNNEQNPFYCVSRL
jgi:hypothetical protein